MMFASYGRTIKLTVLADVHVTPGNANEEQIKLAVDEINASDADAVILNGDLTNEGSDEQLTSLKKILDGIVKPFYVVPGNHENNWSQSACKTFVDLWGADRFIFEIDDLVIAGVNCGPYMKMGDGHVKQEDLIWLDENLAQRMTEGKRFLSFCHYPLNPDLDNCDDYVAVLKKYATITHINGHYHTWKRYNVDGMIDGLMTRALMMNKDGFGYAKLEITSDSIRVYNKVLGADAKLKYAYPINYYLKKAYVQQPLPQNVEVKLVYRDNASIFTRVGLDDKNVYFGNSLGYVKAVDKKNGMLVWQHKTDASLFSRPAVGQGMVVVPTADKRLLWFDSASGSLLQEDASEAPYVADGVISNGVLYQGGGKTFEAWRMSDRKMLWQFSGLGNYCQAAPVVDGNDVVFGAWDTNLRCLNKKNGKLRWQWNNGKNANLLGPGNCVPVVMPDKVIIVAPDRYMTAIDRKTGKIIWRNNSHKFRESLGVSADGTKAYAKTMDGEVVAVSTQGSVYNELWIVDAGLGYEHAPCIVLESNGVIYVGSRRGIMVAINASTHTKLWEYKMGNSEFNGWEVDGNGDVYTSLIEGAVWRVTVK
ncbi:MAG: PQQ-binding-like beta-propeller repeat protein [Muribaculaceae bacterium]